MPPSKDAARIRPCEPPSDQRSCCQAATRFEGLRGFRARDGSTAVSVYRNPFAGPPSQPALKVESCDTRTWVTGVKGGGGGGPPPPPPPHPAASARLASVTGRSARRRLTRRRLTRRRLTRQ